MSTSPLLRRLAQLRLTPLLLPLLLLAGGLPTIEAGPASGNKALPTPHRQFSVRIETTAHQLNATSDYPPYKRYMTVHYDYTARRARIDYDPVPHMPPKSFVRRYDIGFEWMVMEVSGAKECQKSRLREAMPMPRFPDKFIYLGQVKVRGKLCDHWREDHGEEAVEYYETADADHVPVRLTTEAVERTSPERITTPLMTCAQRDPHRHHQPASWAQHTRASPASPASPASLTDPPASSASPPCACQVRL
jgi:hypothetical protein